MKDEEKINTQVFRSGRFIIATNILSTKEFSNDSMIREYK